MFAPTQLGRTKAYLAAALLLAGVSRDARAFQSATEEQPSGVLSSIWGQPSKSKVWFYPLGVHFDSNTKDPNNLQRLLAVSVSGYAAGTFVNSSNNRIYFAGVKRQVAAIERVSFDYLLAMMRGYRGEGLKRFGPIISHDPGPLAALTVSWRVSDKVSLSAAVYGVGGLVGSSFFF
jgi:hypothetical protein